MRLGPNDLKALAQMADELRKDLPAVAEFIEFTVSAHLEGRYLSESFDRALEVHHRKPQEEHGDPFGGGS